MIENYYKSLTHKRKTDIIYSGSIPVTTAVTGVSFTEDIFLNVEVSGITQSVSITIGGDNLNTIVFEADEEILGYGPMRSISYVSSTVGTTGGSLLIKSVKETSEPIQFVKSLDDIKGIVADLRYPLVTTELGRVVSINAECACNSQDIQMNDYLISSGTTYSVVTVSKVESSKGVFHHTECRLLRVT